MRSKEDYQKKRNDSEIRKKIVKIMRWKQEKKKQQMGKIRSGIG